MTHADKKPLAGPADEEMSRANGESQVEGRLDAARHLRRHGPLAVLIMSGIYLRVVTATTRGFWLDETTTMRQASWSVEEIVRRMSGNVHPPLFHIAMHYWVGFFGRDELPVRWFALSFGIVAIPIAYWAALRLYDHRTGLIAAGLAALSPFLIWYSQEARMYSMMLVFALLGTGFFWLGLEKGGFLAWAGYTLSSLMGVFTQYFFLFLLLGQAFYFLLFELLPGVRALKTQEGNKGLAALVAVPKQVPSLGPWLAASLLTGTLFALWLLPVVTRPWVVRTLTSPLNYGWSAPGLGSRFNDFSLVVVQGLFGFHDRTTMRGLVAMWPLLLYLAFFLVSSLRPTSRATRLLLFSGGGGMLGMLALAQWQPVMTSRYFIAVGVPLLLAAARLISKWPRKVLAVFAASASLLAGVAWADQSFNPKNEVVWDNREAMALVAREYRSKDRIIVVPFFISSVAEYYLPRDAYRLTAGFPVYAPDGSLRNTSEQLDQDLDRVVGGAKRVWLVSSWQETRQIRADNGKIVAWLEGHDYTPRKTRRMHQVNVMLFEGRKRQWLLFQEVAP